MPRLYPGWRGMTLATGGERVRIEAIVHHVETIVACRLPKTLVQSADLPVYHDLSPMREKRIQD